MMKRIIAIVSAALLAAGLAACKGGAPNKTNNGADLAGKVYAQQPFDGASVQNGLNPAVNSAGELVTASQQSGQPAVVTTWDADGKQKSAVTTDVTDAVSMLALGTKDAVYLLASPQGGNPTVHVLDASGRTTGTIELTGLQPQGMVQSSGGQASSGNTKTAPSGNMPSTVIAMQPAPDGGVFVSALGVGVAQFDASGKQVRVYGEGGLGSYITLDDKNQLVVYSSANGAASFKTYDAASGKEVASLDAPAVSGVQSLFYDRAGKRLLYMTGEDIRALSADGKTSAVLAAFSDFSLIDGFRQLYGFAVDGRGTIYLSASNTSASGDNPGGGPSVQGGGPSVGTGGNNGASSVFQLGGGVNEMIRLGLVDASTVAKRTEINVAAINGSQVLNQVISAFQKAHPDYKVNLKVYNTLANGLNVIVGPGMRAVQKSDQPNQQDLTSFIQALNTDIMSGSGPDVIVLDDLPWYKYVDKGILADLGQIMADKQFDLSPYYANLFDACKVGGKLYGVPASFSYTVLAGKAADMPGSASPTLSEFMAKAKALPQGVTAFGKQDATTIFEQYIQFCYPELVDTVNHKARFDSPEFIQAMKDFRDLIGENTSSGDQQDAMAEQLDGSVAYNAVNMSNPMQLAMQRAILGDDMKVTNLPTLIGGSANPFSASLMMGINANSKNKDAAWNLIATMLGADVQGSASIQPDGYPVMKSAAQKVIDDMKSGMALGNMRAVMRVGDKEIEAKPLSDADYQSILDAFSKLNTLQAPDLNALKILSEELPTFFSGQKSAEEVAGLIQNRVNTLLNE